MIKYFQYMKNWSCPPFIDLKDEMWQSMLHKFYNATWTI